MYQRTTGQLLTFLFIFLTVSAYVVLPSTAAFAEDATIPPVTTTKPSDTAVTPPASVTDPLVVVPPSTADPATTLPADASIPPAITPTSDTTPPAQGPQTPVGPDANTYIYNPATGLWENAHYIWDPVTKQTKPKDTPNYSYNPTTNHWDSTQWVYNPATGTYVASTATSPQTDQPQQVVSNSQDTQASPLRTPLLPSSQQGLNTDSINTSQTANNGFFDLFHNASISNNIKSTAASGDAVVSDNTQGGSATSGNAQATSNLFNILNSSLGFLGATNPVFFTANLLGNIIGDLLINPGQIPSNSTGAPQNKDNYLKVQSQNTGTINNNLDLEVNSGAATVASNTQAGNATSGNALAMANIMNSINSVIGSGQSFMGMINIYGNFNGDILLPPAFMNSLLASNAQAPQTAVAETDPVTTNLPNTSTTNANLNLNDTNVINNNLKVNAASGNTLTSNNTSAGNATSGSAKTNVTLLNLTGKQVVGKNALLVFVNVLGSWVGLIMNAPIGVTAGVIGDSSASLGSLSSGQINNVNSTTKNTIDNNINVRANSGVASVVGNTSAGNATSGNALAAVNILNISNSNFSLSDWFGILFINVLGNWTGSFGVDTAAGNPINTTSVIAGASNVPQVFAFASQSNTTASQNGSIPTNQYNESTTSILGETTNSGNNSGSQILSARSTVPANRGMSIQWIIFAGVLILFILFGDKALNRITQLRPNQA